MGLDVTKAILSVLHSGHFLRKMNYTHIVLIPKSNNPTACSLLSAGDRSNIILGVPRSNHKEWRRFKDNVTKQQFG